MVKRIGKSQIMHDVVENGGVLYFGGVVGDGASMGEQTRDICAQLDERLAEAGSDKTKLLMAQIFITDMSLKPEMNEAWLGWLDGKDLPARATIGVADLGEGVLIEVVVTAAA